MQYGATKLVHGQLCVERRVYGVSFTLRAEPTGRGLPVLTGTLWVPRTVIRDHLCQEIAYRLQSDDGQQFDVFLTTDDAMSPGDQPMWVYEIVSAQPVHQPG